MKFKMLILSSMLFIAFLTMTALCADWAHQDTQTADQLLDGGEVVTLTPPPGQAATPQLSREAQKSKSSQNWSMPSTLTGGGNSAKESRDQAEATTADLAEDTTSASQDTTTGEEATPPATTELPPSQTTSEPTVAATSLAGSWAFTLNDSVRRDLALTLFQTGSDLFGTGKIREGNNTLDTTASGAVLVNGTVDLDITTVSPITLYKLILNLNGDMAAGEYQASSASGESWKGTVEGQKTG
jgi:hypothetical protein